MWQLKISMPTKGGLFKVKQGEGQKKINLPKVYLFGIDTLQRN